MIDFTNQDNKALYLLDYMHENNIKYTLLRGFDELVNRTYKDVDILAPMSTIKSLDQLFFELPASYKIIIIYGLTRCNYIIFNNNNKVIEVDLYMQIGINQKKNTSLMKKLFRPTMVYADVSSHMVKAQKYKINVLDYSYELFLLLIHQVKKKSLKVEDRIKYLYSSGVKPEIYNPSFLELLLILLRKYYLSFKLIIKRKF
jgi:hypothetical protein